MWEACRLKRPQAVIDVWNKEHPETQIEYVRYVNDDEGNLKLDTAIMTGQDVDLFVNYTISHTAKRVASGAAADLSSFTDYNIDEKMGPDAEGWKIDGKYYGVPTTKSTYFVALNKEALDAANLPVPKDWTWDEMREYAKKLKRIVDMGSFKTPNRSLIRWIPSCHRKGTPRQTEHPTWIIPW